MHIIIWFFSCSVSTGWTESTPKLFKLINSEKKIEFKACTLNGFPVCRKTIHFTWVVWGENEIKNTLVDDADCFPEARERGGAQLRVQDINTHCCAHYCS